MGCLAHPDPRDGDLTLRAAHRLITLRLVAEGRGADLAPGSAHGQMRRGRRYGPSSVGGSYRCGSAGDSRGGPRMVRTMDTDEQLTANLPLLGCATRPSAARWTTLRG